MNIKTIYRRTLNAWLGEGRTLILIDTSLAEDYAAEHLPGALNACVFEVTFLEQVAALRGSKSVDGGDPDRSATIVVYGASERSLASATAAEKLTRAGYGAILDYRGGLEDWRAAGLPLEGTGRPPGEPVPADGIYALAEQECTLEWTGRSLGGKHQGTVALLPGGSITLSGGRAVAGEFGVDMASINDTDLTDSALRKMLHAHLASDDFFDVANHPRAWFRLDRAEPITGVFPGQPNHVVHGRFTLKSVERPLRFAALIGHSPTGDGALVARANFDLDRTNGMCSTAQGSSTRSLEGIWSVT